MILKCFKSCSYHDFSENLANFRLPLSCLHSRPLLISVSYSVLVLVQLMTYFLFYAHLVILFLSSSVIVYRILFFLVEVYLQIFMFWYQLSLGLCRFLSFPDYIYLIYVSFGPLAFSHQVSVEIWPTPRFLFCRS